MQAEASDGIFSDLSGRDTFKSIMNGKSKNPGICNIKKIADGFGMTIREFFDSDIFNDLDQDD